LSKIGRNRRRSASVRGQTQLDHPKEKTVSKQTITAALALMVATALPAYAQPSSSTTPSTPGTAPGTSSAPASRMTATQLQPGQIRATQMDGATVYDPQNQKVGDIKDVILDKDGKVAAVVLDVGAFLGIGGKYVAVGMNDLKVTEDTNNRPRFAIDMSKDQLKTAQAYDLNLPSRNASSGSTTVPANRSDTSTMTPGVPPRR
jgi:sporulation protein YlmC with PRC-barrel domain